MKVLVIGSKGFIGIHLVQYLQQKGMEVWEADVVVDYRAGARYFLVDASEANFQHLFTSQKYDCCVNCSGAASVPDSLEYPMRDYQLNTVNVYKLLEAIRRYQPDCRFINLSSAAVYGNPESLPVQESAQLAPVSPYGYHKMMSEQICTEFHRFFGLRTCSLRIFSAYGEGLYKQLFWDLFQKAQQRDTIHLFGTGEESRDFIYIQDLVQAIHLAAVKAACQGETINLANGIEVAIKDAVAAFYACFDEPLDYVFSGSSRPGDPNNWVADIRILKSWGYKPGFDIKQGLQNYYIWAKANG